MMAPTMIEHPVTVVPLPENDVAVLAALHRAQTVVLLGVRIPTRGGRGTTGQVLEVGLLQAPVDEGDAPRCAVVDASGFEGIEIDVCGNGEMYGLHLRTEDVTRPCQSHRQELWAHRIWQTVQVPFSAFDPHRIDKPLDLRRLRRIGLASRIASYGAA